jgi:hypothetical protein
LTVALGDFVVVMDALDEREKGSDAGKLLLPVPGVIGSVVKLTQKR